MKQKRRKKLVEKEILHQHRGVDGIIFGKLHPLNSKHKREDTEKAHQRTVEMQIDEIIKQQTSGV